MKTEKRVKKMGIFLRITMMEGISLNRRLIQSWLESQILPTTIIANTI